MREAFSYGATRVVVLARVVTCLADVWLYVWRRRRRDALGATAWRGKAARDAAARRRPRWAGGPWRPRRRASRPAARRAARPAGGGGWRPSHFRAIRASSRSAMALPTATVTVHMHLQGE